MASLFWNSASLWPVALVAGLALLALALWWYPGQTRDLPRRWQWVLPLFRVLAVLALVLSLLKPTLVRPRTEEEHGAVLVLVDASASMGVCDTEMSPADQVALADGLGMLSEGKRIRASADAMEALTSLQRELERAKRLAGDVEYARLSGKPVHRSQEDAADALEKAIERAHTLDKALTGLPLETTLRENLKVLAREPADDKRQDWLKRTGEVLSPLMEFLQKRQAEADAQWYASDAAIRQICDRVTTQSRLQLVEHALVDEGGGLLPKAPAEVPLFGFSFADGLHPLPLRAGAVPVKRLLAEPKGQETAITASIASAVEAMKGRPVRAVVVLSDGRGAGDRGTPGQLAVSNVPVYSVLAGKEKAVKDLAIAAVTMPSSAFVGETVTVKGTLRSTNLAAGEYEVSLRSASSSSSKRVRLDPGGTGEVEFAFKATEPGVDRVELSVRGDSAEATLANNTVARPLKVIQDRIHVLLVASRPTWDYQYVRNALARTPWAKLTEVLLDEPGKQLTLSPDQIGSQDIICLFAPKAAALPAAQTDAIHRAVSQKGASLLLMADDVNELEALSRNVLLGEMLPYRAGGKPIWRTWPGDRAAFKILPAEESAAMEVLRLADNLEASQSRWANLPAVYHYLAIPQLKPNAVRTLLVERESRAPVLVESRLGSGKVLFMGLDESWRWRLRVGERDQDRLWMQLIRYGAEEPYALVTPKLALDLDRVAIRPGESTKVRVRISHNQTPPVVELRQGGKVLRVEEPDATAQAQPGRYETLLKDLPPGGYEVVAYHRDDSAQVLRLPLNVGYTDTAELADLSADPAMMRQIAAATGGQMLPLENIRELPVRLQALRNRTGSTTELPLWSSPYLFLLVLGCLATEWAIRKRMGLA